MESIAVLDFDTLTSLIKKAMEKEAEDKLWQQYLTIYSDMVVPRNTSGKKAQPFLKAVSFKEYKDKVLKSGNTKGNTQNKLTKEEIIEKFEAIKNKHQDKTPE